MGLKLERRKEKKSVETSKNHKIFILIVHMSNAVILCSRHLAVITTRHCIHTNNLVK